MAARLGNVLHWVANTVAILLLVVGALRGWVEYMLPVFGHSNDYSPTALLFAAATGAWLLGRTCLYVLAAAPADKVPPTGPDEVFGKLQKTSSLISPIGPSSIFSLARRSLMSDGWPIFLRMARLRLRAKVIFGRELATFVLSMSRMASRVALLSLKQNNGFMNYCCTTVAFMSDLCFPSRVLKNFADEQMLKVAIEKTQGTAAGSVCF